MYGKKLGVSWCYYMKWLIKNAFVSELVMLFNLVIFLCFFEMACTYYSKNVVGFYEVLSLYFSLQELQARRRW